jgi:hypothetical protein
VPAKKTILPMNGKFPVKEITHGPKHHFFGFYDICPWDVSGRYILSHEVDFIDRRPEAGDGAVLGFVDLKKGDSFVPIGETTAWNFQQGARLQWLPGAESKVVYNDFSQGDFRAVVADINSSERKILPKPVYAIHPGGQFGLGLNFARLRRLGGYGYAGGCDQYEYDRYPENDGIYRMDLNTGSSELIVSLREVANHKSNAPVNMKTDHFLTHPVFNSGGGRFCFLHRFLLRDGGQCTRLFTANPDGSDLYCLAEGILSHFDWLDDQKIMIWGRHTPFLTKVRQLNFFALPIFKSAVAFIRKQRQGFIRNSILGDQLLVFTDKSNEFGKIGAGVIKNDGHFTRLRGRDWILGDTYADENHYRGLFVYDPKGNRKVPIGNFYALPDKDSLANYRSGEPWEVSEMRSDLHPRWSRDGREICIDSVHNGSRQIYVVNVGDLIDTG